MCHCIVFLKCVKILMLVCGDSVISQMLHKPYRFQQTQSFTWSHCWIILHAHTYSIFRMEMGLKSTPCQHCHLQCWRVCAQCRFVSLGQDRTNIRTSCTICKWTSSAQTMTYSFRAEYSWLTMHNGSSPGNCKSQVSIYRSRRGIVTSPQAMLHMILSCQYRL